MEREEPSIAATFAAVAAGVAVLLAIVGVVALHQVEATLREQRLEAIDVAVSEAGPEGAVRLASAILGHFGVARVVMVPAAQTTAAPAQWSYTGESQTHYRPLPSLGGGDGGRLEVLWNAKFDLARNEGFAEFAGFMIGLVMLSLLALATAVHRRHLLPATESAQRLRRDAAIARGAQSVAHDLRKPFAVVRLLLDNVRRAAHDAAVAETFRKFAPELERNLKTTDALIADLLEYSRTAAPTPTAVSLDGLIAAAVRDCVSEQRRKGIKLNYEMRHGCLVHADEARLARVIANIFGNALHATNADGQVWFATRERTEKGKPVVELTIGNSGSFIPPEDLAKLFQPFFTKGKSGGTGLGLAIVQKVIRDNGGSVAARSDKDIGTEFVMTLPATTQLAKRDAVLPRTTDAVLESFTTQERAAAPTPSSKKGNALVVILDDDPFFLDLWCAELGDVDVVTFDSPNAFTAALKDDPLMVERIALVITDYFFDNTPETTGDHVAAAVAKALGAPVMICSNISSELPRRSDVVAYLEKAPQSWTALQAILRDAGSKPRLTA